jgi:hypothetical protein
MTAFLEGVRAFHRFAPAHVAGEHAELISNVN